MKFFNYVFMLAIMLLAVSCGNTTSNSSKIEGKTINEEMLAKAQSYFQAIEADVAPENDIESAKIKLGKILYFDKQLSKDGNISCNSCHDLNTYGVDNLATSPGDDGRFGTRNSPTVFNAALHTTQFWDGRAKDVEEQAGMPITNPIEMGMPDTNFVIDRINGSELYHQLFSSAFPTDDKPLNYHNLTSAIGAFERTLITVSRFDKYLNGDVSAITTEEAEGLESFVSAGCLACHKNSLLGGDIFWKFGLFGNYWEYTKSEIIDKGKAEVTNKESDNYIFKVPSLRNIDKTGPYLHDGSIADLGETIRIMGKAQVNQDIADEEIKKIIVFLKALTADIPDEVKQEPKELEDLYKI